ncbi:MAG: hypothetical protein ACKOQU_03750, partial [Acidimicrobiaceae bacterium]
MNQNISYHTIMSFVSRDSAARWRLLAFAAAVVALSVVFPFGTLTSRVANADELLTNAALEGTVGWTANP